MKVHELKVSAHPNRKRVGRGIGSGTGKTAGRGTKGQNARSGGGVRPGFEGGQNPLAKRLPKVRGFKSMNRIDYQVVNLEQLAKVKGAKVTGETLAAAGLVKSASKPIKILGNGEVSTKLTISVDAITGQARSKVEAAGGTIQLQNHKAQPKT